LAPEALDHRHRAGLAVPDAVRTRGARVESEQRTGIDAQHGAARGVIRHTLTLQFADGAHRSYGPKWAATLTVNVKA
jgi:hypothetical protein